jgi:hypothetical protein
VLDRAVARGEIPAKRDLEPVEAPGRVAFLGAQDQPPVDVVKRLGRKEWLNEMLLRRLAEVVVRPSARSRPSPLAR